MGKLISLLIRFIPRKYLQLVSGFGLRIVGVFMAGNEVTCPICGHSYRKFLPYGRFDPRPNALCPACLSLERHRLIWLFLRERSDFFDAPQQILHIAPEQCFMKRFEAVHHDGYITADIESPLAKVKMDIHHMPFEDNRFDFLLCNHVLEHVDDDRKALSEIKRVLKPGGNAILLVPFFNPVPDVTYEDKTITDPKEREKAFGQSDHVRMYGKDYPGRLRDAGFVVNEDRLAYSLTKEQRYAMGITPEIIYHVTKN
ncbi:MAG: methyltransferase domain-containing protein [Bacteroidia bacterium]|nr:methyltransferase domain-containing protein [Bacteroidia bacterium]